MPPALALNEVGLGVGQEECGEGRGLRMVASDGGPLAMSWSPDGAVDVLDPIEKEDTILLPVKTPVHQSRSLVALLCFGFIGP